MTQTKKQASKQHPELGTSWCQRDFEDLIVFYNWFQNFDPFDTTTSGLKSLANDLTSKDNSEINCDNAKSIGQALQQSIDNLPLTDSRKMIKTRKKKKLKD